MKRILLSILAVLFFLVSQGQRDSLIKASGVPYLLNGDGTLTALEKSVAKLNIPKKRSEDPSYQIQKENSTVTVPARDSIHLVLHTPIDFRGYDPSMVFHIYRLRINNGNREAVMQQKPGGGKSTGNERIAYQLRTEGTTYHFLMNEKLPPGEYAFMNMMSMNADYTAVAYCFRVE